jgi:hypothetical protein
MEKEHEQPPPGVPERRRFRLSGKWAAFGLVLAFLITAILIPAVLKLPPWIDFEIVLAVWWAIWLGVLTTLLYHGKRVADDHQLPPPRSWLNWARKKEPTSTERNTSSGGWGGWGWGGGDLGGDAEGCMYLLGAIVAIAVFLIALWFLIEVAIPLVLFLLYLVARGMLSHVINDRRHCKGRFVRSFGWALVWATLYTVPLAGVVWYVHYLLARDV